MAAEVRGAVAAGTRLGHKAGGARRHYDCCIIEDCKASGNALDSATVSVGSAVGCMLTVYSGFAAPRQLGPHTSGLYTEKAEGYMVVALGIGGPCQIRLDIIHLGLHAIAGSHNGFVERTRFAAAVCRLCYRRTGHHRRCRNLTVAAGQGRHSELAADLHIAVEGRDRIYAGRFGGKTLWLGS